ncbi:Hypothetical_protein [Hexamita inflata]|uniref:Hypothetical_protein n=1 Tax=Hexamita inflata TaxID=28002 RepID=A0ABP1HHD5_9EUKA
MIQSTRHGVKSRLREFFYINTIDTCALQYLPNECFDLIMEHQTNQMSEFRYFLMVKTLVAYQMIFKVQKQQKLEFPLNFRLYWLNNKSQNQIQVQNIEDVLKQASLPAQQENKYIKSKYIKSKQHNQMDIS